MAKPFSIQAPENIAKEYGGNKQKIAQAAQMGVVDPTAAVLAGMFIDRMRSAQVMEAAQQPTVAQQVLGGGGSPMPSPQGLGANPAMPPPPPQMPPMAPPQGMAPQGMAPPQAPQMAPQGMAMGGVASLPIPNAMFDEPMNGGFGDGYAGGGLVAFASAGEVDINKLDEEEAEAASGDIVASSRKTPTPKTSVLSGTMFSAPSMLGGLKSGLLENLDLFGEAAPRETKRAKELEAILEGERSPEARKRRKQEDMYMALAQLGATMAGTPGSLLQAASAGIREALPGAAAAAKERRGEERAITKELLAEERMGNKETETRAAIALDMLKGYNTLEQAFQDRNFNNTLTRLGINADLVKARIMAGAGIREAMISAAAQREVANINFGGQRIQAARELRNNFRESVPLNPELSKLMTSNPAEFARRENAYVRQGLDSLLPTYSGGSSGGDTLTFDKEGNLIR